MSTQITVRQVLRLAWPEFSIQLIIVAASIIEMFFISKIGLIEVAAASISNIVLILINNFLGECDAASRSLSSRFSGSHAQEAINKTFIVSLLVPFILGLAIAVLSPCISFLAFYFVGSANVNQIGCMYLNTVLKTVPFSLVFFSLTGFINGMGDTLTPFFIRIFMHTFNVLMDIVLVWGLFGFPKLGIQGVAIATVLTYLLACILSILFIIHKKFIGKISFDLIKDTLLHKRDVLIDYIKISCNVGFQFGFCDLAMYVLALIIERLGVNALAVHQIVYYQIYSALQLPIYSFYIACSIIIGDLFGNKDHQSINLAFSKIFKTALLFIFCSFTFVFCFPELLINLLSPANTQIARSSVMAVKLLSLNLLVDALYIILCGGLLGADDSKFVMIQGVLSEYFILLPLSYLFAITCGMGLIGIYFAFCIRTAINLLFVGWRFFVDREWNKVKQAKAEEALFPAYDFQLYLQNLIDEDIFIQPHS